MKTISNIADLRLIVNEARRAGRSVGFVPTMGYFHAGHQSLMERARRENDLVVVSLFVNPIQFGPNEDFEKYPRDLQRDEQLAAATGVDLLFYPAVAEMYPDGFQTNVTVTGVSQGMCGSSRPGHFQGVATVVLKLFNIVGPDRAYFGEKDAQQLRVIRQLVRDLNLPLAVIGCPIVREADGLAMSSRNVYLNPSERQAALVLSRSLAWAREALASGERDAARLQATLRRLIDSEPLAELEYLVIVNSETLAPVARLAGELLIALAVRFGKTRLIDNLTVTVQG